MQKFWIVTMGGNSGTFLYDNKEKAMIEIEKLVKQYGKRFFLLETTDYAEPGEIPVKWVTFGSGKVV